MNTQCPRCLSSMFPINMEPKHEHGAYRTEGALPLKPVSCAFCVDSNVRKTGDGFMTNVTLTSCK